MVDRTTLFWVLGWGEGGYLRRVKRYEFKLGGRPWPGDAAVLHFYAPIDLTLPDNRALAELISRWREVIGEYPITLLDDHDLHCTLEVVTDKRAHEIPAVQRRQLADAARQALVGVPAYRGSVAGCLSYSSGAIVDVSPAAPLTTEIHQRLRRAVQAVRGPDSTQSIISKAHISLGYATEDADSDPIQKHLRTVDPSIAPLYIPEVQLVEVSVDKATGKLTWETVETISLDG